jgi:hypothetical protein
MFTDGIAMFVEFKLVLGIILKLQLLYDAGKFAVLDDPYRCFDLLMRTGLEEKNFGVQIYIA